MILTVQPAKLILQDRTDGMGYDLRASYSGHHCQLQIGNVSIAFDDRNIFRGREGYSGVVMEFTENTDDPVRVDNISCPKCEDVAETILFALAADLGYTISK